MYCICSQLSLPQERWFDFFTMCCLFSHILVTGSFPKWIWTASIKQKCSTVLVLLTKINFFQNLAASALLFRHQDSPASSKKESPFLKIIIAFNYFCLIVILTVLETIIISSEEKQMVAIWILARFCGLCCHNSMMISAYVTPSLVRPVSTLHHPFACISLVEPWDSLCKYSTLQHLNIAGF